MPAAYVKIKRHEVKCLVEQAYGLKINDMYENDNGIFLHTDQGIKRLRLTNKAYAKLLFAASAYQHVADRGFCNISCIIPTLQGEWCIKYERTMFILQDFIQGKMYEISTDKEAFRVGETLANFHQASKGFVPVSGCQSRVDWGRWMDKYKSNARNMKKYKELLEEEKAKSKFDRAFLKQSDFFINRMSEAYGILKDFGYLEKVRQSMNTNQLAHKSFRRHGILLADNGEIFITDMEECGFDIREYDLATLFESFSGKRKTELVRGALEGYTSIIELDRCSIKIIQALLLEPKKFYKVIERYYGKKKNDTEPELLYKLERSMKKESRKDDVIQFLETYSQE